VRRVLLALQSEPVAAQQQVRQQPRDYLAHGLRSAWAKDAAGGRNGSKLRYSAQSRCRQLVRVELPGIRVQQNVGEQEGEDRFRLGFLGAVERRDAEPGCCVRGVPAGGGLSAHGGILLCGAGAQSQVAVQDDGRPRDLRFG
jgi:hypothetical protein